MGSTRAWSSSALVLATGVAAGCAPEPSPRPPCHEAKAAAGLVDASVVVGTDAAVASAPISHPLYRVWPRSVSVPRTQGEVDEVLRAVFPKYLEDPKQCRPHRAANSWGDIDELIGEMWKAGQFVPTVEQRVEGSFTTPSAQEVLYRIAISHCVHGLDVYSVFAVFDASDAGQTSGPVKLRFGDAELAGASWRILAVVDDGAGPSHLLVAHDAWSPSGREDVVDHVRELVLARAPAAPPEADPWSAHLRARAQDEWLGVPAYWRSVAELESPPPDQCATFYRADAPDDAGSWVRVASERCGAHSIEGPAGAPTKPPPPRPFR